MEDTMGLDTLEVVYTMEVHSTEDTDTMVSGMLSPRLMLMLDIMEDTMGLDTLEVAHTMEAHSTEDTDTMVSAMLSPRLMLDIMEDTMGLDTLEVVYTMEVHSTEDTDTMVSVMLSPRLMQDCTPVDTMETLAILDTLDTPMPRMLTMDKTPDNNMDSQPLVLTSFVN